MAAKSNKGEAADHVENAVGEFDKTLGVAESQLTELRRLRALLNNTVDSGSDRLMRLAQNAPTPGAQRSL